jgi:UDP-glucose 4-epimerase
MKIAIIGAKSFIGCHLINELIVDDSLELYLFSKSKGKINGHCVETMETFYRSEKSAINFDLVYYLASDSIPASSWENPFIEIENNLIPFLHFLTECTKREVKKVIFISSAGTVYGPSLNPLTESSVKEPFSPYGINKLTMEYYLQYWKLKFNLHFDIFRVSNVYGEGQNTSKGLGVINSILENIALKKITPIFGDGSNIRNFVHVEDVAKVLSKSYNSIQSSGIYNLSSDSNLSVNELISCIEDVLCVECLTEYLPSRGSDNPSIVVDNKELKKLFPNFKFIGIEEGILRTYRSIVNV